MVAEEVEALKPRLGGDLALGGAELAGAFMRLDLIDEYRLYVHPVVIGAGKPLFREGGPRMNVRLIETQTFGNGVVLLHYERN